MSVELDRLYLIAQKSLQARQAEMEVLSDNMSNVNTPGFRQRNVSFQAALGAELENLLRRGVEISAAGPSFGQGPVQPTGQPFDLAIDGDGFFSVQLADGRTGYTRLGNFRPDAQGRLVNDAGALLLPPITIPPDSQNPVVDAQGVVTVMDGETPRVLGRLQLARFTNPGGLVELGDGVYVPTDASGAPVTAGATENGLGQIIGGALEMSNVNLGQQLVNMLRVQRSYTLTLKALQISDQMTAITNQLMG